MKNDMDFNDRQHWHLNKGVPIALIFAILIQTFGAVWWASSITTTVNGISKDVGELSTVVERDKRDFSQENLRQWSRINTNESSIQKLESIINTTNAILQRLEAQVKENNDLLKEYLRGTNKK